MQVFLIFIFLIKFDYFFVNKKNELYSSNSFNNGANDEVIYNSPAKDD